MGLIWLHLAAASPFRRIRGRDVIAAVEERDAKQKLAASASADFEPFSSVRRQIAEAVTLSRRTIPSFVIDRWVETAAIDQARRALGSPDRTVDRREANPYRFSLVRVGRNLCPPIPRILDRWHEENGRVGRMRASSVDIGLVVALSDGVMIPVLRDLAGKSIR